MLTYAPFIPEAEKFLQAGDVIRIYHQEMDAFMKSNITPLYNKPQYQGMINTFLMLLTLNSLPQNQIHQN
jgi:hypothetical protein